MNTGVLVTQAVDKIVEELQLDSMDRIVVLLAIENLMIEIMPPTPSAADQQRSPDQSSTGLC